jgi:PPOX class probable F420-dependent enzyme
MQLPKSVRAAIEAAPIAQIVTLAQDGSPHVSMAWVGLDGDDVVIGSLVEGPKQRNLRRDPRCAVSFHTGRPTVIGLPAYVVLHGHGRVTEGGAPELLQRLAEGYLGPGAKYPPMPNPPAGFVTSITTDRINTNDPIVGAETGNTTY